MQLHGIPESTVEKFGFRLRPETATIKISAPLEDFRNYKFDSHRQINLPEVTATVGPHSIACRLCLCQNELGSLISTLKYKNDDVRVELSTHYMVQYEDGPAMRYTNWMPLHMQPRTVAVECTVKFFYVAMERVEIADLPVNRPGVILRTSEGDIIPYDAALLSSASEVFKGFIERSSDEFCIIDIINYDKATVETALTFLRGDIPYKLTDDLRRTVKQFATDYRMEHITERLRTPRPQTSFYFPAPRITLPECIFIVIVLLMLKMPTASASTLEHQITIFTNSTIATGNTWSFVMFLKHARGVPQIVCCTVTVLCFLFFKHYTDWSPLGLSNSATVGFNVVSGIAVIWGGNRNVASLVQFLVLFHTEMLFTSELPMTDRVISHVLHLVWPILVYAALQKWFPIDETVEEGKSFNDFVTNAKYYCQLCLTKIFYRRFGSFFRRPLPSIAPFQDLELNLPKRQKVAKAKSH